MKYQVRMSTGMSDGQYFIIMKNLLLKIVGLTIMTKLKSLLLSCKKNMDGVAYCHLYIML